MLLSTSCDVRPVLLRTVHGPSRLKNCIETYRNLYDSGAQSSCKVIAALITPEYALVLRSGDSRGTKRGTDARSGSLLTTY